MAKRHAKVANQRKDFLHNKADSHTIVCVEDLNMKAMEQSLNFGKSVSDNGWEMFVTFLQYKLTDMGKQLVKVVQALKPVMFVVTKETKKLRVREWDCPECGTPHDRDVNVAINIKNEGMRSVNP